MTAHPFCQVLPILRVYAEILKALILFCRELAGIKQGPKAAILSQAKSGVSTAQPSFISSWPIPCRHWQVTTWSDKCLSSNNTFYITAQSSPLCRPWMLNSQISCILLCLSVSICLMSLCQWLDLCSVGACSPCSEGLHRVWRTSALQGICYWSFLCMF